MKRREIKTILLKGAAESWQSDIPVVYNGKEQVCTKTNLRYPNKLCLDLTLNENLAKKLKIDAKLNSAMLTAVNGYEIPLNTGSIFDEPRKDFSGFSFAQISQLDFESIKCTGLEGMISVTAINSLT